MSGRIGEGAQDEVNRTAMLALIMADMMRIARAVWQSRSTSEIALEIANSNIVNPFSGIGTQINEVDIFGTNEPFV